MKIVLEILRLAQYNRYHTHTTIIEHTAVEHMAGKGAL